MTLRVLDEARAGTLPRTLSVNPSPTITALAARLADRLHADARGCLRQTAGTGVAA